MQQDAQILDDIAFCMSLDLADEETGDRQLALAQPPLFIDQLRGIAHGILQFGQHPIAAVLERLPSLRGILNPAYTADVFWRALYTAAGIGFSKSPISNFTRRIRLTASSIRSCLIVPAWISDFKVVVNRM